MSLPLHPIQFVTEKTGLSAHVIRIWEKRYGAVTPQRTGTNRRLYSDEEIERLTLLRRLSETGHSIGYVAKLPTERLHALLQQSSDAVPPTPATSDTAAPLLNRALSAVRALDPTALDAALREAELQLGGQGVLVRLISPLAKIVGDEWRDGSITAAHEHFATAAIRNFLSRSTRSFAGSHNAPTLIVATPAGQMHELGALLASAAAGNLGWRVIYLGASLPAADIAHAALQNQAVAVALSIVYPEDDPLLDAELARIAELLPQTALIVGGRAMPAYRASLDTIGARQPADLVEFGTILDEIRKRRAQRAP